MSHTSEIKSIQITDVTALKQAVKDLNKLGVKCSLLENATPRAYYTNQTGMGEAQYVLKLDNAKYDVGLYKEGMTFVPRTDFFGGSVEAQLSVKDGTEQGKLGKLFNLYAANATINTAIRKGYRHQRIVNKETGLTDQVLLSVA